MDKTVIVVKRKVARGVIILRRVEPNAILTEELARLAGLRAQETLGNDVTITDMKTAFRCRRRNVMELPDPMDFSIGRRIQ